MAQISHGTAEFVAPVLLLLDVALLVLDNLILAVLYDVGIFGQMRVYVGKEGRIYVELGEHVASVYGVALYLVQHFQRVGQGFGMLGEELRHFLLALQVFLLGVAQTLGIVYG